MTTDYISPTSHTPHYKIETFQPPLVVFAVYGQQENQYTAEHINNNTAEWLNKALSYADRGYDVVVSGDLNLKIGAGQSGLVNNEPTVSKGGQFLLEALEETDLEIANKLHKRGPGRTHVDATAGSSRTLDITMTNSLDKIENYESYKEEWQSELSKAMDNLELTKAELSNVNNQVN